MIIPTLSSALPAIKDLTEASDFSTTVAPYIPQFYKLPQQVLAHITDASALKHLYLSTNPLITTFALAIYVVAPIALIVGEINKNYSQIDRVWSIIPVVYNCHYALWAHLNGLPAQRVDHVMALTVLWGARLTYNYWRKGGYTVGSEDYRWVIVRKYAGKLMPLFNFTFISFGQSFLLFLVTTPTYILLLTSLISPTEAGAYEPTIYDKIFPPFIITLIALEYLADQQQWDFHQAKTYFKEHAKPPPNSRFTAAQLDRGFNTTGLFAYSRHPNFACEQAVWVAMYQWCCCESFAFMNWAFVGAFSYLILFQASTAFTEMISSEKYPLYRLYQLRVGKFLWKARTGSMEEPPKTEKEKKAVKNQEVKNAKKGKAQEMQNTKKGKGRG